jgi:hypothetical protein
LRAGLPLYAELDAFDTLSREQLDLAGFQSELIVAVERSETKEEIQGFVAAYGSKLKSCWAAFFTTRSGDRAAVENRVLQIESRTFRRIVEHTIEERVRREPAAD